MSMGLPAFSHLNDPDLDKEEKEHMLEYGGKSIMYVPLLAKDQVLGFAEIWEGRQHREFSDEEIVLAQGIAQQAAIAMENASLYETTKELADRLIILHRASQELIGASTDPENIYTVTHQAANQLMPCEAFNITIFDHVTQEVNAVFLIDRAGRAPSQRIPVGEGLTGHVTKTGQPLRVSDILDTQKLDGVNVIHYGDQDHIRAFIVVPMRIGEKFVGTLSAQSYQPHDYTHEDQLLLEMLAANAAVALENARLFNEERLRRQEAETLRNLTTSLTSSLELDRVLNTILNSLDQVIHHHSAGIFLGKGDELVIVASKGFIKPKAMLGKEIVVSTSLFKDVKKSKAPVILEDVSQDPRWQIWDESTSIHGWMGIPMIVNQEIIGYISIDSHEIGTYSPADSALAQTIANQAAMAIENARLFENARQRLREIDTLYQISQEVVASLDINEILKRAVDLLQENFNYYHVHVYMINEQRSELVMKEGSGSIGVQLKYANHVISLDTGIVGHVASSGQALISNDISKLEFYYQNPLLPETAAELAVPLRTREGVIGVLDIQHQPPNNFDLNDMRLVTAVADQLSVALDKALLYSELQESLENEKSTRSRLVQAGKLTALGRIVASVSHELNNPLQAIHNALFLIEMENTLSEQSREDLKVAMDETARMSELINRLKDTYRPTTAEEFQLGSLNTIITEVHKLIATHLRHNYVHFEFTPDPDLPKFKMIEAQIKQVLLNLCLNAIETMQGNGELHVKTCTTENEIIFTVSDNGPGIEEKDLPHIFEPFFTRKEGGTGLGLSISYDIIQNHKGSIEVESQIDHGTTFRIKFPKTP